MPRSSQPCGGHLMSEEVRGSAGIPQQPAEMTVIEVWCLCWIARPFCQLRWVCYCHRCTSASSWSAGKHKTSLSPPTTRPQTLPSMCLKTGLQVSACLLLFQVHLVVCFWWRNRDGVDPDCKVQSAWWSVFNFSILTNRKANLEKLRCWDCFNWPLLFKLCLFRYLNSCCYCLMLRTWNCKVDGVLMVKTFVLKVYYCPSILPFILLTSNFTVLNDLDRVGGGESEQSQHPAPHLPGTLPSWQRDPGG